MHDRLTKFLVRDSSTSNLDGELGSCAMDLRQYFVCMYYFYYLLVTDIVIWVKVVKSWVWTAWWLVCSVGVSSSGGGPWPTWFPWLHVHWPGYDLRACWSRGGSKRLHYTDSHPDDAQRWYMKSCLCVNSVPWHLGFSVLSYLHFSLWH